MQDKDKYLEISKHFIRAFRTDRNSTIEDNVQLHRTCPSIFVSSIVFAQINALIKSDATTSSLIRTIMNSIIKIEEWVQPGMNYTQIKQKHPNELAACIGK